MISAEELRCGLLGGLPRLFAGDTCVAVRDDETQTLYFIISRSDNPDELESFATAHSITFISHGYPTYSKVIVEQDGADRLVSYIKDILKGGWDGDFEEVRCCGRTNEEISRPHKRGCRDSIGHCSLTNGRSAS